MPSMAMMVGLFWMAFALLVLDDDVDLWLVLDPLPPSPASSLGSTVSKGMNGTHVGAGGLLGEGINVRGVDGGGDGLGGPVELGLGRLLDRTEKPIPLIFFRCD